MTVGVRLGVNLVQLDSQDGKWSFGAGSPYLHPLVQFRVGDPAWIFIGGTLEYDRDSGDGPDQLYLGAQVGVGFDL